AGRRLFGSVFVIFLRSQSVEDLTPNPALPTNAQKGASTPAFMGSGLFGRDFLGKAGFVALAFLAFFSGTARADIKPLGRTRIIAIPHEQCPVIPETVVVDDGPNKIEKFFPISDAANLRGRQVAPCWDGDRDRTLWHYFT